MNLIPGLQNLCTQRDWGMNLSMKGNVFLTFLFKTNQHWRLFLEAQFNNSVKTFYFKKFLPFATWNALSLVFYHFLQSSTFPVLCLY